MDTPRQHILLVEDEPGIRSSLGLLLELEGYRVSTAEHGAAGLAQMEAERPHLVITDYMMPTLDGIAMIRRMRAQPTLSRTPVLLMSGAFPAGLDPLSIADAFVAKPAPLARLLTVVEGLLASGVSATASRQE